MVADVSAGPAATLDDGRRPRVGSQVNPIAGPKQGSIRPVGMTGGTIVEARCDVDHELSARRIVARRGMFRSQRIPALASARLRGGGTGP